MIGHNTIFINGHIFGVARYLCDCFFDEPAEGDEVYSCAGMVVILNADLLSDR